MDDPPIPTDLTTLSFEEGLQYEERLQILLADGDDNDAALRGETLFEIGLLRHTRGDYAEAGRAFVAAADAIAEIDEPLDLVRALVWGSESYRLAGQLKKSEGVAQRALQAASDRCEEGVPMALSNLAMLRLVRDRIQDAYDAATEAVEREEASGGGESPRLAA